MDPSSSTHRQPLVSSARPHVGLPEEVALRRAEEFAGRSRRDSALESVIGMIADGSLLVGSITSENDIAQRLGMSRTPLREALAILSRDGLVRQLPQVGFGVVRVLEDDVLEILAMRRGIEPQIAERLASTVDRADTGPVHTVLNQMEDSSDLVTFGRLDTAFHTWLAVSAGYANAARAVTVWRNRMRVFRCDRPLTANDGRAVVAEHRAILSAIDEGNTAGAFEAADLHLVRTQERISSLASSDEPPVVRTPVLAGAGLAQA